MGNIGLPQLLILLAIVLLVFGTKRVRSLGSDLGGAIREFRKGVGEDSDASKSEADKSDATSADDNKPAKD
ncbi:MAG: twin-arginine translocase TatA/TatE family subunit [Wenzhouxiangella sp.]